LAALALRHRDEIYARTQRATAANLPVLERLFAEHGGVIRWVRPAGGMTAFPWLADGADAREFCRSLAKRGVLMAPGDCFGMPRHFRVGFAASGDRFAPGLQRVAEFLGKMANPPAMHADAGS
jgi:aspartate/methionine/tyrosine aminotransferase